MLAYLWQNLGNVNQVAENNNYNQCVPKKINHFFKGITYISSVRLTIV